MCLKKVNLMNFHAIKKNKLAEVIGKSSFVNLVLYPGIVFCLRLLTRPKCFSHILVNNSVLINKCVDGNDFIAMHSDVEKFIKQNYEILYIVPYIKWEMYIKWEISTKQLISQPLINIFSF